MFLMFMSRLDIVLKLSKFYSTTTPVSLLFHRSMKANRFVFYFFFGTIMPNYQKQ